MPFHYDQRYWDRPTFYHVFFSEFVGLAYIIQLGAPLSLGLLNPFLMRSWLQEANMDEGQLSFSANIWH